MGIVFNIQRYCIHDGDGIRTNVFLKGCPLNCLWCHNPEGLTKDITLSFSSDKCTACAACLAFCNARKVSEGRIVVDRDKCLKCRKCADFCPMGANELLGKEYSAKDVFDIVRRDKIYYETSGGGVTLSGGEPSMQGDFSLEIIRMCQDDGIACAIETCGMGAVSFYEKAFEYSCLFLFDIKCMDSEKHKKLTGVGNERILDNLNYLFSLGAEIVIRLPMIPGINDSEGDIKEICDFLCKNDGRYRYAEIMPYHSLGVAKAQKIGKNDYYIAKNADDDNKKRWSDLFSKFGVTVKISQ